MARRWRFADVSLRRKLLLMLVLSSGTGLLLTGATLIWYGYRSAHDMVQENVQTLAQVTAVNATAALAFDDVAAARELLTGLRAAEQVRWACLYRNGPDGQALFADYPPGQGRCPERAEAARADGVLLAKAQVKIGDEPVGELIIAKSTARLQHLTSAQVRITLSVLGASFLLSLAIAYWVQRYISEPLMALKEIAQRITATHDYSLRAQADSADEIGQLVRDFNAMIERIEQSSRQLQQARDALAQEVADKTRANAELERAMENLKAATEQLVQSEKLASLGGLVAGVAHEINTPVGVGVTAASTLLDETRKLEKAYEEGRMKRSDLEAYLQTAAESAEIILKNLHRAANLIQSFKQVAVDQSSEERREFELRSYIDEVLTSLRPRIKRTCHQIEVDCPDGLVVDSYPGALAQILTNLVTNSLVHAFPDRNDGHIRIRVRLDAGEQVVLDYADDGVGIPEQHLARIFDPFFTTRRGAGGSGLGLHIVYNLTHRVLGGRIESVHSRPGEGFSIRIRFPVRARRKAA